MNIVNSTQNFTTSTRQACKLYFNLRHTCINTASAKYSRKLSYTLTNMASAKFTRNLCHISTNTASAKLYARPLSHFSKYVLSSKTQSLKNTLLQKATPICLCILYSIRFQNFSAQINKVTLQHKTIYSIIRETERGAKLIKYT